MQGLTCIDARSCEQSGVFCKRWQQLPSRVQAQHGGLAQAVAAGNHFGFGAFGRGVPILLVLVQSSAVLLTTSSLRVSINSSYMGLPGISRASPEQTCRRGPSQRGVTSNLSSKTERRAEGKH